MVKRIKLRFRNAAHGRQFVRFAMTDELLKDENAVIDTMLRVIGDKKVATLIVIGKRMGENGRDFMTKLVAACRHFREGFRTVFISIEGKRC